MITMRIVVIVVGKQSQASRKVLGQKLSRQVVAEALLLRAALSVATAKEAAQATA